MLKGKITDIRAKNGHFAQTWRQISGDIDCCQRIVQEWQRNLGGSLSLFPGDITDDTKLSMN